MERWALPATQARSRATRARVLAAAERVFGAKGYDGARLADIAEEAGCSVGAVYFRFKDKDALFFAIVESFIEEARAGLGVLLEGARSLKPKEVIRIFVVGAVANFRRHKGLFRAVVERGLDHPEAMQALFGFRDELGRALEKALSGRDREPGLPVRTMTQMVYGFLLTGILNHRAPTRLDDASAVAELTKACICYLLAS